MIKSIQINNNGEGKFEGQDAQMMSQISSLMRYERMQLNM